jgi:hypothetical protein
MNISKSKFIEDVAGSFYQVLRAAGVGMVPEKGHERIREISATLAASIEHRGEVPAIRVIKKLQVAIKKSFSLVDEDITELKNRIKELEDRAYLEDETD